MADLYAILGVPRDADVSAIRRAFRRKVRSAHPDGGGSAAAFGELKAAYEILSDPASRRRYDETGEHGAHIPDRRQGQIVEFLAHAIDQSLLKLSAVGMWRDADILPLTQQLRVDMQTNARRSVLSYENTLDQSRRLQDRFRVSEGDNLMETVIAQRIKTCRRNIDLLSDRIELIDEALAVLARTSVESLPELMGSGAEAGSFDYSPEIAALLDHSTLVRFK